MVSMKRMSRYINLGVLQDGVNWVVMIGLLPNF